MIGVRNYFSFCEQGVRGNNEDFIYPATAGKNDRIFVLCDGMGGHGHGEVASETVGMAVYRFLEVQHADVFTEEMLREALDFAVEELEKADNFDDDERRMGTTLVVVVLNEFEILIGHVGDSRCYHFSHSGELLFRTTDHSQVAEAVRLGLITEDEAFNHPKKNILTRCVQAKGENKIEMTIDRLKRTDDGDILLLCTDGVNDALRDADIERIVRVNAGNLDACAEAVKTECGKTSRDNYSAQFIELHAEGFPPKVPETPEPQPEPQPEPKAEKLCDNCWKPNAAEARFCTYCGHSFYEQAEPVNPPEPPIPEPPAMPTGQGDKSLHLPFLDKPVKQSTFFILLASVIAGVIVIVVVLSLLLSKNDSQPHRKRLPSLREYIEKLDHDKDDAIGTIYIQQTLNDRK